MPKHGSDTGTSNRYAEHCAPLSAFIDTADLELSAHRFMAAGVDGLPPSSWKQ
jgi:hypothetical protein